jgi:hypothetical protein
MELLIVLLAVLVLVLCAANYRAYRQFQAELKSCRRRLTQVQEQLTDLTNIGDGLRNAALNVSGNPAISRGEKGNLENWALLWRQETDSLSGSRATSAR